MAEPGDAGDDDGVGESTGSSSVESIAWDLERKLSDLLTKQIGEMQAGMQAHMGEAMRELDSALQSRVQHVERRVIVTEQRIEDVEGRYAFLEERLRVLEQELAVVQRSDGVDQAVLDTAWERPPRLQMLRANCTDMLSLAELKKVVRDILEAANIDEGVVEVQPIGQEPSKNFVIDFAGHAQTGARRAQAVLDALRQGRGEWKKVFAKTLGGQQAQVYIQPDRSQRKSKEEAMLRKAAKVVKEMRPEWNVHQL